MKENRNILVTGGSGFIGKSLLSVLAGRGRQGYFFSRNGDRIFDEKMFRDHFTPVEMDLRDKNEVEKWLKKYRPEFVVHLAGATQHSDPSGDECFEINWKATRDFFETLIEIAPKKVVTIGTADEYGNQKTPQNELMTSKPATAYAESKRRAAEFALKLNREKNFPVVILRVFTAYGAGQPPQMFLSQLIKHAIANEVFEMTDGRQKRDYIYVDDVAKAIFRAVERENVTGKIFNVGSGAAFALREIAAKVWRMCDADFAKLKIGARPKPPGESFDTQADISAARESLDWKPTISLDEGLRLTVEKIKSSL